MIEEIKNKEKGLSVREKLNEVIRQVNKGESANTDYSVLSNKPAINDVKLGGNLTLEQLGILAKIKEAISENNTEYYTKDEVTELVENTLKQLNGSDVTKEDLEEYLLKSSFESFQKDVEEKLNNQNKQKEFKKCDIVSKERTVTGYLRDSETQKVYTFDKETSSIYLNGVRYFPEDWKYDRQSGEVSFNVLGSDGDLLSLQVTDSLYLEAYFDDE